MLYKHTHTQLRSNYVRMRKCTIIIAVNIHHELQSHTSVGVDKIQEPNTARVGNVAMGLLPKGAYAPTSARSRAPVV